MRGSETAREKGNDISRQDREMDRRAQSPGGQRENNRPWENRVESDKG